MWSVHPGVNWFRRTESFRRRVRPLTSLAKQITHRRDKGINSVRVHFPKIFSTKSLETVVFGHKNTSSMAAAAQKGLRNT